MVYVERNQAEILSKVTKRMSQNINGKLTIDKISFTFFSEFPNLSLTVQHPLIKDSLYNETVFEAKKVYFRLNALQLLRLKIDARSVVVQDGYIYFRHDSTGYFNANLFKANPDTTYNGSDINLELKKLRLSNVKIVSADYRIHQHISLSIVNMEGNINRGDTTLDMPLHGMVHIDSMLFKPDKGSFLVNMDAGVDANLQLDTKNGRLVILPSPVFAYQQQYSIKGEVIFSKSPAYLSLTVTNPAVDFSKARRVLSDKILASMEGVDVKGPVGVNVFVRGDIIPGYPPEVDVTFKLNKATVLAYGVHLNEVTMDGLFMNHVRPDVRNEDSNSAISFHVSHALAENVPFTADVSVTDLKQLFLEFALTSQAKLADFNSFIPSQKYRFTAGSTDINVKYKGTLNYYLDSTARGHDDTLSGHIKLIDGAFEYDKRKIQLVKMNADIDLGISSFYIKNLSAAINGNAVYLKGSITSLRRIFDVDEQRMTGDFDLDMPNLNLTTILTENIMSEATAKQPDPKDALKAASIIDQLTDRMTANLNLTSNRITYRKFTADNLKGKITLSAKGIVLKNLNLNACRGNINVNGGLNTTKKYDRLQASVQVKNVDVKEFLQSAEDFNQDAVTHKNLQGKLSLNVDFNTPLDKGYVPVLDSMQGHAWFALKQGELIDFEPLANISNYIFKKRDFENITFADIHDSLILKNGKLFIPRMEVATSVMRIFIQGQYAFKGITDIAVQVPLNNLRKMAVNYKPENVGTDARVGANIILRVYGENDKTKITLDPFAIKRLDKEQLQ